MATKVNLTLESIKINDTGIASSPFVIEFYLRHQPGDQELQILRLPTEPIEQGKTVDFSDKSLKKRWIRVTDVEKKYILGAKVRPGNEQADKAIKQGMEIGTNLSGQLLSRKLPLRWWLISDILQVGYDVIDWTGLLDWLDEPFVEGHIVLDGSYSGGTAKFPLKNVDGEAENGFVKVRIEEW
jgi:hypothetical protein